MYSRYLILCGALLLPTPCTGNFITGIIRRTFGPNFHAVVKREVYRSGTPPLRQLAQLLVRKKIKSVINLRGACPGQRWWIQERALTRNAGITQYDIALPRHTLPSQKTMRELLEAFKTAPRPLLIHGDKGTARTSLAAAIYTFLNTNATKQQAAHHLSDSYGYFSVFYPAQRGFYDLLPADKTAVSSWLNNYSEHDYPHYNNVTTPRMYPTMNFGIVDKDRLYRSAQLKPIELHAVIGKYGIKTIINLMGAKPSDRWWRFEHATARHNGAIVHDIAMSPDALPTRDHLIQLLDLYERAPRPLLIHCRDGADRTGLASAIWKLHIQNATREEALNELSLRYFHFAPMHPALRFFIEQWHGSTWARTHYDPADYPAYQQPLSSGKLK